MGSLLSSCCRDDANNDDNKQQQQQQQVLLGETGRRFSVFYDAKQNATASMMMAASDYYPPATDPPPPSRLDIDRPETLLRGGDDDDGEMAAKDSLQRPAVRVAQRGYPGDLTPKELEACLEFRRRINDGDGEIRDMVRVFDPVEDEALAICRFLRARRFDVDEAMNMASEHVGKWREANDREFYTDLEAAVGCPRAVLSTQFPYNMFGKSRSGCPVDYLLAGRMSLQGVECVTEVENVPAALWHETMYDFKEHVGKLQADDPNVVRPETLTIVDLMGLDKSQLNKKVLDACSEIFAMMGCFPELLNKMVIVNAPWSFGVFWKVIRPLLHPRTTAKIEIYSNEREGKERLSELINRDQLLSDYDGDGPSFDSLSHVNTESTRHAVALMSTTKCGGGPQSVVNLSPNEKCNVTVYSKKVAAETGGGGAMMIKLWEGNNNKELTQIGTTSSANGGCTEVSSGLVGPGKFHISSTAKTPDGATTMIHQHHFVVYADVFPIGVPK